MSTINYLVLLSTINDGNGGEVLPTAVTPPFFDTPKKKLILNKTYLF